MKKEQFTKAADILSTQTSLEGLLKDIKDDLELDYYMYVSIRPEIIKVVENKLIELEAEFKEL
jgi:hypothetical protein